MRRDIQKDSGQKEKSQFDHSPSSRLEQIRDLYPYLKSFYQKAANWPGIHGLVFIIGGMESEALACLELGANEVIVANPLFSKPWYKKRLQEFDEPRVRLMGSFAEDVDLEAGCVDVILSTCVIEHILDVPAVLDKIGELLKPGGRSLIHGGPVWTGPRGHHLWTVAKDGTKYFFDGSGDDQPVRGWEHLLYSPGELQSQLISRGIPSENAREIEEHIYFSQNLSRISPTEIEQFAIASGLRCVSFKRIFDEVPDERITQALSDVFSIADLSTWAVEFILEKVPEDKEKP